ncbi:hypothetical protein l11_18590 [Neisseria weaveri LMG 5135]|nr:hypothetical protein l11_18590 [Neisseria weaveri LMG 5135]EGV37331.1 hypothetical protein l13_03630 [Neisseria weaveri ATCC 51223]
MFFQNRCGMAFGSFLRCVENGPLSGLKNGLTSSVLHEYSLY